MRITDDELIRLTSNRLNLPDQQVRFVMIDFWRAIRSMLQNPEVFFYKGIRIKNFGKFILNPSKVLKDYTYKLKNQKELRSYNDLDLFETQKLMIKYDCYTQRQKEIKDHYERHYKIPETGRYWKILHEQEPDPRGSRYSNERNVK